MNTVPPLIQMITGLTASFSVLSPWESCALNIIEKDRPSTVLFFCKSSAQCPNSIFYRLIGSPSQTIIGLETHELPALKYTDLVFLALHEDEFYWGNDTIQKYRMTGRNDFKVVVVVSLSGYCEDFEKMEGLFRSMWQSGIVRSTVMLKNESKSQMYTYFPFKKGGICEDTSPVFVGECYPTTLNMAVFDIAHKITDLNKCPIRMSFSNDKPWIMKNPLSGRISGMIQELSSKLNFSIEITAPLKGRNGGLCGPEEYTGSKGDLVSGNAEVALGLFNRRECSTLHYITMPHVSCLSWCTPVMSEKNYIIYYLLELCEPLVWVTVTLSTVLAVVVVLKIRAVSKRPLSPSSALYLSCSIFAVVPLKLRTTPERLFVASWLLSCLVLRSAYEGELKSKSAVPLGSRIIRNLEDLLDLDLELCTTIANLQALQGVNEPITQTLADRTNICKGGLFEYIKSAAKTKSSAVLTSDLRCRVSESELRHKGPSLLYPLTGGCIKVFQFVPMVTLPGLPYNNIFQLILLRCYESGLVNKWIAASAEDLSQGKVRPLNLQHIFPALFLLFLGIFAGTVLLFMETIYFRWSLIKSKFDYLCTKKCFAKKRRVKQGTPTL